MMNLSGASNDFFYCFMRDEASFSLKYSVTFSGGIQLALLKRAANEAMRLFPEFAVRPVIRNNKLEMTPNDSPLVFCEEPGPVKFYGSADTNGYMLYFVCEGRKLSVYFNHGFADAVGMTAYLSSVLTLYAAYIGKAVTDEAFLAGVRTPGNARPNPDPGDMYDPYRRYGNTESVPEYSFDNPGAFTIPMEPFPPETNEIHEYLVDISTADFLRLTKKLGASFTPLMIDIAAQAVYRHYDTGEDPVIAMLPVNRNVLFDTDRMLEALNRDPGADPETLVRTVRHAIDRFVGDAPQFDDITMLALRYNGALDSAKELTVDAVRENFDRVYDFLDSFLNGFDCSPEKKNQVRIAVEELFVNIASYAYSPETGTVTVRVKTETAPPSVTVTFVDAGVPFDPLKKQDPDIALSPLERQIGGLGIFMVKKMMDETAYEYRDGKNVMTIKKILK